MNPDADSPALQGSLDACQNCGAALPRPSHSACRADPCPQCRHPRPLGDCSDLTWTAAGTDARRSAGAER